MVTKNHVSMHRPVFRKFMKIEYNEKTEYSKIFGNKIAFKYLFINFLKPPLHLDPAAA